MQRPISLWVSTSCGLMSLCTRYKTFIWTHRKKLRGGGTLQLTRQMRFYAEKCCRVHRFCNAGIIFLPVKWKLCLVFVFKSPISVKCWVLLYHHIISKGIFFTVLRQAGSILQLRVSKECQLTCFAHLWSSKLSWCNITPCSGDDEMISFVCVSKQTLRTNHVCSGFMCPSDASWHTR